MLLKTSRQICCLRGFSLTYLHELVQHSDRNLRYTPKRNAINIEM